ncbi:carbon-nitrogen hydrolase family protein [Hirschia litorea]|uniref:Carbon-nitrogen hydrolase family protein n=1 Tax=Hirschia litorea TaxID=1199156 RepID=A0ABW2IJX0_9PROT
MTIIHCACIQLRSSENVADNIQIVSELIREAASMGAEFILTPENTGFLDIRRGGAVGKVVRQSADACLAALSCLAGELGVWLQIGSLAVLDDKTEADAKYSNRSFLINPNGQIVAHYDKIHMFDVEVGDGQSYKESRAYEAGQQSVLVETPFAKLGMSICYDLRFPYLYRQLAQAGANLITIPAAFTKVTGEAHWHALIRARAIENGAFVMAAAQGGLHSDGRETFGHSLIVSPWGEVIAEAELDPCVITAKLDMEDVKRARARIPSLQNERTFSVRSIRAD